MSESKSIGLKELIRKVKEELLEAHDPDSPLFAVGSIELEISFTVERSVNGGIAFWVITAGAEGKLADVHTVKVILNPLLSVEEIAQGLTLEAKCKAKKALMRAEIPELADVRVPFGKAALRRPGRDLTIVAWGRAVWTAMAAAERLAPQGIEVEILDLRTLVPPDLEAVYASVGRTGRLLVAAEDRAFAGFVRSIQGHVVQEMPGTPTRRLWRVRPPTWPWPTPSTLPSTMRL